MYFAGDFNFPSGEKNRKGYRDDVKKLMSFYGLEPTFKDQQVTYVHEKQGTRSATDNVFLRDLRKRA